MIDLGQSIVGLKRMLINLGGKFQVSDGFLIFLQFLMDQS